MVRISEYPGTVNDCRQHEPQSRMVDTTNLQTKNNFLGFFFPLGITGMNVKHYDRAFS